LSHLYVTFAEHAVQYWIMNCNYYTDFPIQPTGSVNKIWTIAKTEESLIISCDGVELLNYVFSESSDDECVSKWGGNQVDEIRFSSLDTASNFYRAGTDWIAVGDTRDAFPWDLESTPIQITTNSEDGSGDQIWMVTYNNDHFLSHLYVTFAEHAVQYWIMSCNYFTDFPIQPTGSVNKIWTIAKTEESLIIYCDGVELLNYVFSESSDNECVSKWGGNQVDEIRFSSFDKASRFYRAGTEPVMTKKEK